MTGLRMGPQMSRFLPATVILGIFLLTPFSRSLELPFLAVAIFGASVALSGRVGLLQQPYRWALLLYICFMAPMLIALPGAVNLEKSVLTTLGSLRCFFFTVGFLALTFQFDRLAANRDQNLSAIGALTATILVVWNLDAALQFYTGTNVLGYGTRDGYINSFFGDGENLKYGITTVLLLPIALVHVLRSWHWAASMAFSAFSIDLLIMTGQRTVWIFLFVELALIGYFFWSRGKLPLRVLAPASLALVVATGLAFHDSNWARQRAQLALSSLVTPSFESINTATSLRLPIWAAAVRMAEDNWMTGVGPRGFRFAYSDYASATDERWTQRLPTGGARASHAHQTLLDIACETGVPGLAGFAALCAALIQLWRRASAEARLRALPFGTALAAYFFPLNSHLAWYSSWTGTTIWLLVALYLYAIAEPPETGSIPDSS
jgi:O-antigen ligase